MVDTTSFGLPECVFLAVRYAPAKAVSLPGMGARAASISRLDGKMRNRARARPGAPSLAVSR